MPFIRRSLVIFKPPENDESYVESYVDIIAELDGFPSTIATEIEFDLAQQIEHVGPTAYTFIDALQDAYHSIAREK